MGIDADPWSNDTPGFIPSPSASFNRGGASEA
jgi:hypothetical protein